MVDCLLQNISDHPSIHWGIAFPVGMGSLRLRRSRGLVTHNHQTHRITTLLQTQIIEPPLAGRSQSHRHVLPDFYRTCISRLDDLRLERMCPSQKIESFDEESQGREDGRVGCPFTVEDGFEYWCLKPVLMDQSSYYNPFPMQGT